MYVPISLYNKTYLNRKHKPLNENASEIRKSKFAIFVCLLSEKHRNKLRKKSNIC